MISQNRLRMLALKNDFATTSKKYQEAMKYYGISDLNVYYNNLLLNAATSGTIGGMNMPPVIYPMPVIKHSRTLMKQASLPRMPVPALRSSLHKFLNAVKPLVSESELEATRVLANEFVKENGLGEKLQRLLVEKSKTTDNWLAQWWLDKIYLEPRYSVVNNVNPGTLYTRADYKTLDEQVRFATKYIVGFLDFKKFLEDQKLPVEKLGDSNLCMDQYYKLFGTCRVPNKIKDDLKIMQVYNIDLTKTNHVTVMYNNRIFSLQVIDPATGLTLEPSEIYRNLKELVEKNQHSEEIGLGILTSENRDNWYEAYSSLSKSEKNRKNFESIHDSLFVLCLDTKEKHNTNDRTENSAYILHGNKSYTANRWFDKTIQAIIGPNGVWGVNFEHSIAEAVPHAFMNDYINKFILSNEINMQNTTSTAKRFKELEFDISNEVKSQMKNAYNSISNSIDNLELYTLDFEAFGKNFPKSQKVSPDAFVQMAMQLAFYRLHNKPGNAYESGSLRKFHLGRTEIIRTCSTDAVEFVRSMTASSSTTVEERAKLLLKAINSHRQYTNSVLSCETFDRHLLGLKLVALENDIDLPEIYKDVAYQRACHYLISSSQVTSKFEYAVTSYGPAVEDGYGACYSITEKKISFGLSSLRSSKQCSAYEFGQQIQNALIDCQSLLQRVNHKL